MKEIGGYFQLELDKYSEYHSSALAFNSERNAFKYFLQINRPRKVHIPHYICDSMIRAISSESIDIEKYYIDTNMYPIITKTISKRDVVLIVNYFGINSQNISKFVVGQTGVIVDNSHAFYATPIKDVPTLYSPRKFFGVPDGGYLYLDNHTITNIERDHSWDRMNHLLKRLDLSAHDGYKDFKRNENLIDNLPIRTMSKLTQNILSSIDYNKAKVIREKNFAYLHNKLGKYNRYSISVNELAGPLIYPFMANDSELNRKLNKYGILTPTYWTDVLHRVDNNTYEHELCTKLIALPIDQRYSINEMQYISDTILSLGNY